MEYDYHPNRDEYPPIPDSPELVKAEAEARVSLQMRELERPAMHRVLAVVARHFGIPLKDLLAEIRAEP